MDSDGNIRALTDEEHMTMETIDTPLSQQEVAEIARQKRMLNRLTNKKAMMDRRKDSNRNRRKISQYSRAKSKSSVAET